MALKASIDISVKESGKSTTAYDIGRDLNGEYTLGELLQFTKDSLINISREALKEEQAKGFDKEPVVLVDGRANKNLESVNPLGKIEFIAKQNLGEIVLEVYRQILTKSPAQTGLYKLSNIVTVNGVEVANTFDELDSFIKTKGFIPTDKIRFINTQPYARKLERFGVTASGSSTKTRQAKQHEKRKGGTTFLVPNGVYSLTYNSVKRRYGKNTFIKFELVSGDQLDFKNTRNRKGKVYRNYVGGPTPGRPYLYPTILIYAIESGLNF